METMDKFDYYGLFVTENQDKSLLEKICATLGQEYPDHKEFADHVTLLHHTQMTDPKAVELKEFLDQNLGEKVVVTCTAIGESDKCIALAVTLPTDIQSMNKIPHITLLTFNGGKPFQSNQITHWRKLKSPFNLYLTIKKIVH